MFYKIISSALLLGSLFFISCQQTPIAQSLSDADRLVIQFIEQGKVIKTVTSDDKAAIKKMVYALGKGEAKQTGCEINGRMIFYNNETKLQQMEFSSIPECRYFSYNFEGNQEFSSMTNETANFLQSVKEGLDFY
jgi:protein tyrosine phosphatase